MQGTRHEDTMDVFIHSADSVDLLSCCIEHGLVDTAWTAVQAVHRRRNMMLHLESESSSVSVLPAVFLSSEIVLSESKIFHETDASPRLTYLRTRSFATNESNRFYLNQNLSMSAAFQQTTLRWILRCLFAFCLSTPISSAISPVQWDYPLTLGLARSHGFKRTEAPRRQMGGSVILILLRRSYMSMQVFILRQTMILGTLQ